MKKFSLILSVFLLTFLFLLIKTGKNVSAQTPCSEQGLTCGPLDPDLHALLALDGEVRLCTESELSYQLNLRLSGQCSQTYCPYYNLIIFSDGYSIEHRNVYNELIHQTQNNNNIPLFTCDSYLSCTSGATSEIGRSSGTGDLRAFRNGIVRFDGTVEIEVDDINCTNCWYGTYDLNCTTNPCSCSIGGPAPPPSACTPNPECGAGGECLPSQICAETGECILASYCHCNPNAAPGQCGGGGCPPTHYCYHDVISGQGICLEDPENCHPCDQDPGICGEQCNLLQQCIGGYCRFRIIECTNPTPTPGPPPPRTRCDPVGQPLDSGVDTAIGCIPVITATTQPFITFMLRWAFAISGGLAFLLILYAGYQIITSAGNPQKIAAGKELLTAAIAGLLLLIFSVYVLETIGVDILRLPGL